MVNIRLMQEEDIPAVRQIEALAFDPWWKLLTGTSTPLPERTSMNIRMLMSKDPNGALIAELDQQRVGFIFSRTWGSVGWFGTFAVLPTYQGKGIGKSLIAASTEYLRKQETHTIGLETMPMSASNLGLYLKLGFQPNSATLSITKQLSQREEAETTLDRWSSTDKKTQERWLSELMGATCEIYPGLDYSKEILATDKFKLGETLILTVDHQAVGLSIVWLASTRVTGGMEKAGVQILVLHPEFTSAENLLRLINGSTDFARAQKKQTLALSINTCHTWALEQLLNWGFKVERMRVRMVLPGDEKIVPSEKSVDLSHWAG